RHSRQSSLRRPHHRRSAPAGRRARIGLAARFFRPYGRGNPMNRRDFLKTALAAACATAFTRQLRAEEVTPFRATDRIFLGPQKIECSRLFLGTGTNGWRHESNQTRQLGIEGLSLHLRSAFDAGLTSWDSADQYGSHPHLARALADGAPREK